MKNMMVKLAKLVKLARVKFDRDGEGGSEALGMRIVLSISEMDQNWNQLDLRKVVHILKTVFQYFYYLVFGIPNTSNFKLRDVLH